MYLGHRSSHVSGGRGFFFFWLDGGRVVYYTKMRYWAQSLREKSPESPLEIRLRRPIKIGQKRTQLEKKWTKKGEKNGNTTGRVFSNHPPTKKKRVFGGWLANICYFHLVKTWTTNFANWRLWQLEVWWPPVISEWSYQNVGAWVLSQSILK